MKKEVRGRLVCLILIVVLAVGFAQSAVLDINLTPGGSAAGFTNWTTGDKTTPSNLTVDSITLSLVAIVSDFPGQVRSIDRGGNDGYSGTLADLTQTWWGARASTTGSGGSMTIDIDGLTAGNYTFTSWHHDHEDQTGTMKIEVSTDGGSTFTEVVSEFDIISGDSESHVGAPNEQTFTFTATGSDSVQIRFTNVTAGTSSTAFFVVNGFRVEEVIPTAGTLFVFE